MTYQQSRATRRESRSLVGRFKAGKLAPVMAVAVRGSESGFLSQSVTMELDPIAGRMITPITAEFISVFVPVQAADELLNDGAGYAGVTDVVREKLLSGNPLFQVGPESEVSMRCGVNPRRQSGVARVSDVVHLSHNAAVNFLRQRKYVNAALVSAGNKTMTPALISQTALQRMNGVLDPEDRVNGRIDFQGNIPVKGIGIGGEGAPEALTNFKETAATGNQNGTGWYANATGSNASVVVEEDPNNAGFPGIFADLAGAEGVSLTDFYNAETMDRLTRHMRMLVDQNAQYGEEMALRWAHGLSVDSGKVPFIISEQTRIFGRNIVGASDTNGVNTDVMRSDMALTMNFNVPLPKTELGGVIITFATVKPDETISSQPHPYLARSWTADNFVADELALDPVPVVVRDLDSDCAQGVENNVVMYIGNNGLKRTYVSYGLARNLDPNTIESKTAVWQLEVPLSVTPESVIYPENLDQYPFADGNAEICTYTINSQAVIQTPTIFGPTPVEEMAVLEDENVFGDN